MTPFSTAGAVNFVTRHHRVSVALLRRLGVRISTDNDDGTTCFVTARVWSRLPIDDEKVRCTPAAM